MGTQGFDSVSSTVSYKRSSCDMLPLYSNYHTIFKLKSKNKTNQPLSVNSRSRPFLQQRDIKEHIGLYPMLSYTNQVHFKLVGDACLNVICSNLPTYNNPISYNLNTLNFEFFVCTSFTQQQSHNLQLLNLFCAYKSPFLVFCMGIIEQAGKP